MKTVFILLSIFATMANASFGASIGCAPRITGGSGTGSVPNVAGAYTVTLNQAGEFTLDLNPEEMNKEKKVNDMVWSVPGCATSDNEDILFISLTGKTVGSGRLKAPWKIDGAYSIDASCAVSVVEKPKQ